MATGNSSKRFRKRPTIIFKTLSIHKLHFLFLSLLIHTSRGGAELEELGGGAEQGRRQLTGMVLVAATTGDPPSSGGNRCAVEGNCLMNYQAGSNYGSNEDCTFRLDGISGPLVFEQFSIEGDDATCSNYWDYLTIAGNKYCGSTAPTGLLGGAGSEISWHTDGGANRAGFKVCVAYCPSNCAAGSGCEDVGSTSSCAVCPGEQNDRALESM